MTELKKVLERLAAFAHDVFAAVLHLPDKVMLVLSHALSAAVDGLQVGVVAGAVTVLATGKPFTAFLVGGLWGCAFASYSLMTGLYRGRPRGD